MFLQFLLIMSRGIQVGKTPPVASRHTPRSSTKCEPSDHLKTPKSGSKRSAQKAAKATCIILESLVMFRLLPRYLIHNSFTISQMAKLLQANGNKSGNMQSLLKSLCDELGVAKKGEIRTPILNICLCHHRCRYLQMRRRQSMNKIRYILTIDHFEARMDFILTIPHFAS